MSLQHYIDNLCGWKYSQKEIERIQGIQPYATMYDAIKGTKPKYETTLLHQCFLKVLGKIPIIVQETGDCVAFGMAGAINLLKAVEIILKGEQSSFGPLTATEPIYGISRVIVGQGYFRGQQGSTGAWAAEGVKVYGTCGMEKFGNVDLTRYDVNRATKWGDQGVPQIILDACSNHLVRTITKITTIEEFIVAIENGYPVTIASNQGFSNRRDKDGFAQPQGSWPHQMYCAAVRFDRHGALVINSWPETWISGPKTLDQPEGSFWVDLDVLEERIIRPGDCWAISQHDGYPPQTMSLRWF